MADTCRETRAGSHMQDRPAQHSSGGGAWPHTEPCYCTKRATGM